MISIFVCSRINGNKNSKLLGLVESLIKNSNSVNNYELLVKFDDDDNEAFSAIKKIEKLPVNFSYLFGKRERGYIDIHKGYASLIKIANPKFKIYTCFADDFIVIQKNWDLEVLKLYKNINLKYFIIHQRPHPPQRDQPSDGLDNSLNKNLFFKKFKFRKSFNPNYLEDLYVIDEAPMWSAELIKLLNSFGTVSFTDAWTLVFQNYLFAKYKVNITYFTNKEIIYRNLLDEIDGKKSKRWSSDRKFNFNFIKSDKFIFDTQNEVDKVFSQINKSQQEFIRARLKYLYEVYFKNMIIEKFFIVTYFITKIFIKYSKRIYKSIK